MDIFSYPINQASLLTVNYENFVKRYEGAIPTSHLDKLALKHKVFYTYYLLDRYSEQNPFATAFEASWRQSMHMAFTAVFAAAFVRRRAFHRLSVNYFDFVFKKSLKLSYIGASSLYTYCLSVLLLKKLHKDDSGMNWFTAAVFSAFPPALYYRSFSKYFIHIGGCLFFYGGIAYSIQSPYSSIPTSGYIFDSKNNRKFTKPEIDTTI